MQKLKDLARRGILLAATAGLILGIDSSMLPTSVFADALNPLTERTLLLSSSAPGYVDVDGSGNPTYAEPGSGPNGMKSGETFTFKNSTAETTPDTATHVVSFTFQFCTQAAGLCTGPGDDTGDPGGSDDATHSDLNVQVGSGGHAPSEVTAIPNTSSTPPGGVAADDSQGNFAIEYSTDNGATWTLNPGWTMAVSNVENGSGTLTGKDNFVTLKTASHYLGYDGTTQHNLATGTEVKVQYFGTDNNYITNPGDGAYFVKINDYNSLQYQNFDDNYPNAPVDGATDYTCGAEDMGVLDPGHEDCPQNVIDGGVTVANVMNNSIQIHTKVLETLDFSVGTNDPDTETVAQLGTSHEACDPVNDGTAGAGSTHTGGVINLGNTDAENALDTHLGYDNFSYWRLSSNSTNGATVYYSGETLSDTEGDQIGQTYYITSGHTPGDDSAEYSKPGSEQFGLGLDVKYQSSLYGSNDGYVDDYTASESKDGSGANNVNVHAVDSTAVTGFVADVAAGNPTNDYYNSWHLPELYPLVPMGTSVANEDGGTDGHGTESYGVANGNLATDGAGGPRFSFDINANTIPVPIASESNLVVNCSTGLMRYVGNIAATTPAGIYTTAVNYLAAPEY